MPFQIRIIDLHDAAKLARGNGGEAERMRGRLLNFYSERDAVEGDIRRVLALRRHRVLKCLAILRTRRLRDG